MIQKPVTTADPQADMAFLAQAMQPQENLVAKKLSLHVDRVWQQNQKDNKQVRIDMVNILRRVRGEYEPVKLAAIRAFKGSEAYIRSSENKSRSADSWIKDIYRGDADLPWELEPTSEPTLPDDTKESIVADTQKMAMMMEQDLIASGAVADKNQIVELMRTYYSEQIDKKTEEMKKLAKKRCERAASLIRDQNQEGGWNDAFKDFLYYFVRLKCGIIKGPVLSKKKKQIWNVSETGYTLETVDDLVLDSYCVSPFNFFPSKGMKGVNNGDLIEIHELTKQSIAELIGVPGYSEVEIRAVLDKFSKGELSAKWFTIDDETVVKQVTKEKNLTSYSTPPTQNSSDLASETILAQEYWGTVSGSLLVDWGIQEQVDPNMQYQANCWKIGDHVIKAVINPDTLGRKPYHVTSWAKNPEWIWGEGLIEFAAPIEDAINAITRALINNIAIASGPMCEIDKDRVDTKVPIHPWRQIESTSMQMKNEGDAVKYYQPQMYAESLINAWQFFSKVMDEMTVPAYAQGASQSGVTAGTATVFTQLLAAASRSIKAVIANIDDDVITPHTQMCYDYNMKFTDDDQIKGDARVVAKGVSGLLAKEQQAQRKVEYLQVVATNPTYQQILGAKNIGSVLAQVARSNDITLPDRDRLEGNESIELVLNQMLAAQAGIQSGPDPNDPNQAAGQAASGGGAPKKAVGQNPDGSKAGINNG